MFPDADSLGLDNEKVVDCAILSFFTFFLISYRIYFYSKLE